MIYCIDRDATLSKEIYIAIVTHRERERERERETVLFDRTIVDPEIVYVDLGKVRRLSVGRVSGRESATISTAKTI